MKKLINSIGLLFFFSLSHASTIQNPGIPSVNLSGSAAITGAVTIAPGTNVTASQSGSTITINSSGSGGGSGIFVATGSATSFPSSSTVNGINFDSNIFSATLKTPATSFITIIAIPAATISAGSLGSGVIASSLAINSVVPANVSNAVYPNITGVGTQTQALNMGTNKINAVVDPTLAQDAATKNYVDNSIVNSIAYKDASRLATTTALPANTYSPTFKTLTGISLGALTVDGALVALNDRILVKNEATQTNNGIYTVTTLGTVGVAYILTRSADYNSSSEIATGDALFITSGTANTNTGWVLTTTGTITLDTSNLVFVQFAGPGSIIFQSNGSALSAQSPVNFQNGIANNGLTINMSNPSAGNVQANISGTLLSTAVANGSLNAGVQLGYLVSASTGLTGTLASAQFPALTGDITTPGGSLATTAASVQNNITTFGSSVTINGAGGVKDVYGMSVGSFTGAGLSTCGDNAHALAWSSTNNLFTCQSITGSGGSPGTVAGQIQYTSDGATFSGVPASFISASSFTLSTGPYVVVSSFVVTTGSETIQATGGMSINNATFTVNVATNMALTDNGFNFTVWPTTGYTFNATTTTVSGALGSLVPLSFQIGANEYWNFQADLYVTGVSGGMEFGVNGPTGSTCTVIVFGNVGAVGTFSENIVTALNTADTVAFATTAAAYKIQLNGSLLNSSTAGVVQLQWKSVTGGNTSTINSGSQFYAYRTK